MVEGKGERRCGEDEKESEARGGEREVKRLRVRAREREAEQSLCVCVSCGDVLSSISERERANCCSMAF